MSGDFASAVAHMTPLKIATFAGRSNVINAKGGEHNAATSAAKTTVDNRAGGTYQQQVAAKYGKRSDATSAAICDQIRNGTRSISSMRGPKLHADDRESTMSMAKFNCITHMWADSEIGSIIVRDEFIGIDVDDNKSITIKRKDDEKHTINIRISTSLSIRNVHVNKSVIDDASLVDDIGTYRYRYQYQRTSYCRLSHS